MGSAETQVAKKLVNVLLDLFPLPPLARKVVDIPVAYLFDRGGAHNRKTISFIANRIATELAQYPDDENPGSAISASYNVIEILGSSGLDSRRLVALNLDKDKVFSFLLAAAQPHLSTASQLRQRFIHNGLKEIAEALVESAPELPGVPLAFMQAMLDARNSRSNLFTGDPNA